jgi:hypothetical protein
MDLKITEHKYYSSGKNFWIGNFNGENFGRYEEKNWEEFKEHWFENGKMDHDLHYCFRYDIENKINEETGKDIENEFKLLLFIVEQKKGNYVPVIIESITKEDMPEIEVYLKDCWEYTKNQWVEISTQK